MAALMVALSHSMGAIALTTPPDELLRQAANLFGSGAAAGVTIFFVLSGHVLGLQLGACHLHPIRYWPMFMLRRIMRIYPAMLVNLIFCAIYLTWLHTPTPYPAASRRYYDYWYFVGNWEMLYQNVLLINNAINPVTWTLQVELLGAVVLPFLYLIKVIRARASLVLLVAWLIYFLLAPNYSYARTGFIFMFIIGLYVSDLSRWLGRQLAPYWLRSLALLSALGCCVGYAIFPETASLGWVVDSICAWVLLAAVYALPNQYRFPVLDVRAVRFLGKISYSFYLWHFPVLYLVGTAMFGFFPAPTLIAHPLFFQWALFALTSLLAVGIAAISFRYIEHPCKKLHRLLR